MSKPLVIGFPQSSFVWTVRAALGIKGVDHDFRPIDPPDSKTPEYLADRHPWGKVPAFEHGDLKLFETSAICVYVDQAFDGPALTPSDAADRARVEQIVSITNCYLYPAIVVRYALHYIFPRGPEGKPDRAIIEAALPDVKQALGVLDGMLGDSKWFVGDSLTVADLFVGPLAALGGMFPESKELIGGCANLSRLVGQLMQTPGFAAAAPQQG